MNVSMICRIKTVIQYIYILNIYIYIIYIYIYILTALILFVFASAKINHSIRFTSCNVPLGNLDKGREKLFGLQVSGW